MLQVSDNNWISIVCCNIVLFYSTHTCTINYLFLFPKGCNTNGGDDPNVPCVFPFVYNGITYNECTDVDNGGVSWCATYTISVLFSTDQYVLGHSGNCEDSCPGVSSNSIWLFIMRLCFKTITYVVHNPKVFFTLYSKYLFWRRLVVLPCRWYYWPWKINWEWSQSMSVTMRNCWWLQLLYILAEWRVLPSFRSWIYEQMGWMEGSFRTQKLWSW